MGAEVFEFPDGDLRGWSVRLLIRSGKVTAEQVARKLSIRASILRDISPAVEAGRLHPADLPAARARNVEWAADELDVAGETIVALASTVPRTMQDTMNEAFVESMATALMMIRDNEHGESWSAGVAMSVLAACEESGWKDSRVREQPQGDA